ncbi:hypothetical protein C8Q73DRAFT_669094 [Cubamyces lactineus]|nr:hypothetical protein C8Q73DRAFT_669094 [Cubamyces lactineus]
MRGGLRGGTHPVTYGRALNESDTLTLGLGRQVSALPPMQQLARKPNSLTLAIGKAATVLGYNRQSELAPVSYPGSRILAIGWPACERVNAQPGSRTPHTNRERECAVVSSWGASCRARGAWAWDSKLEISRAWESESLVWTPSNREENVDVDVDARQGLPCRDRIDGDTSNVERRMWTDGGSTVNDWEWASLRIVGRPPCANRAAYENVVSALRGGEGKEWMRAGLQGRIWQGRPSIPFICTASVRSVNFATHTIKFNPATALLLLSTEYRTAEPEYRDKLIDKLRQHTRMVNSAQRRHHRARRAITEVRPSNVELRSRARPSNEAHRARATILAIPACGADTQIDPGGKLRSKSLSPESRVSSLEARASRNNVTGSRGRKDARRAHIILVYRLRMWLVARSLSTRVRRGAVYKDVQGGSEVGGLCGRARALRVKDPADSKPGRDGAGAGDTHGGRAGLGARSRVKHAWAWGPSASEKGEARPTGGRHGSQLSSRRPPILMLGRGRRDVSERAEAELKEEARRGRTAWQNAGSSSAEAEASSEGSGGDMSEPCARRYGIGIGVGVLALALVAPVQRAASAGRRRRRRKDGWEMAVRRWPWTAPERRSEESWARVDSKDGLATVVVAGVIDWIWKKEARKIWAPGAGDGAWAEKEGRGWKGNGWGRWSEDTGREHNVICHRLRTGASVCRRGKDASMFDDSLRQRAKNHPKPKEVGEAGA